jgi:hypothetical protein
MGRPNIYQQLDITPEDLLELHDHCIDVDHLALDLGISKKTLLRHLKTFLTKEEIHYKIRKPYRHTSKFAQWLREHPDVKLPPSVPEIEKLTGLNRFIIHHYLNRRLNKYYKKVKANWTPFLQHHRKGKFLIFQRSHIPVKLIEKVTLTIDKFSLIMDITFILNNEILKTVKITEKYFNQIITKE